MTASITHRLDGLEPDNLLAFLALLGTVRAVACANPLLRPRVSWTVDAPPLRPQLHLALELPREALASTVALGIEKLSKAYDFAGRVDLNYSPTECREALTAAATAATTGARERADLLAALMHDAAIKDNKEGNIDPTPMCLLFGQGHQHFLQRLAEVPRLPSPPPRGRGKLAVPVSPEQAVCEALFQKWHRLDPTPSFRWDPAEDIRYATMGGDPTDSAYKSGTQHAANRLAAIGLPLLSLGARTRAGRARPVLTAGRRASNGAFSIAWPIWRLPLTLGWISALMGHPALHTAGALRHMGVEDVLVAQRISVGKFMNFSRARSLSSR